MVVRRFPLRSLAGGVTGLLLGALVPACPASADPAVRTPPAQASAPNDDAPLAITIEELTPGALPRSGPMVVRGTITNVDLEDWQDISIYPVFSSGPDCQVCVPVMTTTAELELAALTDPEAPVGERETSVRDEVSSLAPGQSASYSLRISQKVLRDLFPSPTSGVYWFGVHALGESATTPRDTVADGRARTFLPYLPPSTDGSVDTAVVLPLRGPITHATDGALGRTSTWQDALALSGTLGGPLAFGAASGIDPVTWLVDPAIFDAARQLAGGNLPREIRQAPDPEEPSASDDPSDEESGDDANSGEGAEPGLPEDHPIVTAATSWLQQAETVLGGDAVATLPYGDPDLSAAADHLPSIYRTAREHPGTELDSWDLDVLPAVGAPNGYLDPTGVNAVDDGAVVLLGDQMFPTETFSDRPPTDGMIGDRPVVVTATSAAAGGPGPDSPTAAVALRQRILSEAALRLLADPEDPEPLVVVLPASVTATDAAGFWGGLDLDWMNLVQLDDVVTAGSTEGASADDRQIDPNALTYPEAQEQDEVRGSVLIEAGRLIRAARSYQAILGDDYEIGEELIGEALAGTSYALRGDRDAAGRLGGTRLAIEEELGQVTIDAPNGVTLSGTSGGFSVSVRNALPYPVTVNVAASTDDGARIGVANPVQLAANSRTSVPITADMSRTGVHNVTLRLTDPDGEPIGADDELPLRSGQVGIVIWIIMGTGAAILFVAIGIRLSRRVRGRSPEDTENAENAENAEGLGATP
ncbi:MAG: DUF6049 family protein [Propionibacteriales bacterium]|nr:DUF6049 family protein [Propionibacteriales bacterium]